VDVSSEEVRIRPYGEADLPLLRALLGSEAMTRFIGGPEADDKIAARHERYLDADPETNGLFTILVGQEPVGWVGFWESAWGGAAEWECGWHVLGEHQGRGVAGAAARLLLDEARTRDRHRFVDAFPAVDNVASNALCRRLGFRDLGDAEVEYPKGSMMRARHWRFDLEDRPREASYRVVPAAQEHVALLPAIERSAATLFGDEVPADLLEAVTPESVFATARREGTLWVAVGPGDEPVGFARVVLAGARLHLAELDVLPEHARRGVGTALVRRVLDRARSDGFSEVTLTTYRDVPWNAPFYAGLGFVVVPESEWDADLRQRFEQEAGVDSERAKRVVMRMSPGATGRD